MILELTGGMDIFLRSPKDSIRIANFVQNDPGKISEMEVLRMKTVMRNFIVYKKVEIALIVLSMLLLFAPLSTNLLKVVGMGLLIQSITERRGHIYRNYLLNVTERL